MRRICRAAPVFLVWSGLLSVIFAAAPQEKQNNAYPDPAPPAVQELASRAASIAREVPEVTLHRRARPLDPAALAEDWPGFMGPRRDLHSRETLLDLEFGSEGPPLVWEMERGGGYASPAVQGERLVFTHRVGDEAVIECLEAQTGRRFWQYRYPCTYGGRYIKNGGPRATPQIAGDRVYVHGVEGRLIAFELSTGRILWQRNTTEEFGLQDDFFGVVASPLVVGDLLIQNVGVPGGDSVLAFDRHTGRVVWGAGEEWGASCASPVLATLNGRQKLLVFAGGDSRPPTGGLFVIDLGRRAVDASFALRSRTYESVNGATPIVHGSRIFLTAAYGVGSVGLEFTADDTLREVWKNRHLGFQFSTPILQDESLIGIDGVSGRAGALVRFDPDSGQEVANVPLDWEEVLPGEGEPRRRGFSVGEGSLLFADGKLLVLGDMGHLLVLQLTEDGAEILARTTLFLAPESWTPLVLSHGLLFVCQNNRARFGTSPPRLLCYDLRAGQK